MDKREASGGEWASTLPCRMISGPYDPPGAGEVLVEGMTAMSLCIATFWEQQLCTRERSCFCGGGFCDAHVHERDPGGDFAVVRFTTHDERRVDLAPQDESLFPIST